MDIAVIGAGRVGSTLGRRLTEAGHRVHYARRDPSEPVPERLEHGASTGTAVEVVDRAEVVLLATPWAAVESAIEGIDFGGRPLLDATNPIGPGFALTHGHTDSGAEQVQRWAPTARVVKVFNSTGQENMAEPGYPGGKTLMLACSDDDASRDVALGLAADIGFEAHGYGKLSGARELEPLAMVWIRLAMMHGMGRGFALGALRR